MIYIAHRGASSRYPENTLLAFRKALEAGAEWLELDVHCSRDGHLVVIHDETLERTTDGEGAVASRSLEELRRLDAGLGEKIPLLSEVLELVSGKIVVNIELKGAGTAVPTARLLQERLRLGSLTEANLLISSLATTELAAFSERLPKLKRALIVDRIPEGLWRLAAEYRLWSLHVALPLVTAELVSEAGQHGVQLLVFTVNRQSELRALLRLGVAGVFTDKPELWQAND